MEITQIGTQYESWHYSFSAQEQQFVAKALKKAKKLFPQFNQNGLIRCFGSEDELLASSDLDRARILYAKKYIEECGIIKTLSLGSYSLKHQAEKWAKFYISNGAMLAAAIALDVPMRQEHPSSPNALLAVSKAGVKKINLTLEENKRKSFLSLV